jgi:hypothetical protein
MPDGFAAVITRRDRTALARRSSRRKYKKPIQEEHGNR